MSKFEFMSPKAIWFSQNSTQLSTEDGTSLYLLSQYAPTADTSKDLPSNCGWTGMLDTSPTGPARSSYHSTSSDSENRVLEKEIANLTGERYTLSCRLQWIDTRLEALREQLKHLHSQGE